MAGIEADAEPAYFGMGRVAARTFEVFGKNFFPFLVLSTISIAPPMLLSFIVARYQPVSTAPAVLPNVTTGLLFIATGILQLTMAYFLQGALVQGTVTTLNGAPASLGDCLSTALRRLPRLIGLGILSALAFGLGALLLVVPGLILITMWSVVVPVCVVEDKTIGVCFSRSRELTRNHRWAIFGLLFGFGLICLIAGLAIFPLAGVSLFRGGHRGLPSGATYWIANTLLQIVTSTIGAVGVASIYYELRTIKEGIGPEQLAAVFA